MKSIHFEGANKVNESQRKGEVDMPSYSDGISHVTAWQFSNQELQEMIENNNTFYLVGVFGLEHPAVGITTQNPVPAIQINPIAKIIYEKKS